MADQITDEQSSELKNPFCIIDMYEDGYMIIQERERVMRFLGKDPTEAEFQEMAKKLKGPASENELKEAFRLVDKDQDGFIFPAELHYAMAKLGEELTDKEVKEMIWEGDVDGDGKINYEEFVKLVNYKFY